MEVEAQYGDQVRFVGVPGLAGESSMRDFVASTGTDALAHIPDEDGVIWDRFGVTQQRTYVYIDDDGSWRTAGYGSLANDVADLIAQ
ncbi:MAG: hypothetical protein AAGC53_17075 [Actinomycetota bacterium]